AKGGGAKQKDSFLKAQILQGHLLDALDGQPSDNGRDNGGGEGRVKNVVEPEKLDVIPWAQCRKNEKIKRRINDVVAVGGNSRFTRKNLLADEGVLIDSEREIMRCHWLSPANVGG